MHSGEMLPSRRRGQDSQHPRARAVYIGNVVIPCQCVVKYQPKVFMCPDLGDGDPVHSHKWALFCCPSNCEMLALGGAICLSHSSTKVRKDRVKVSMHALACALRLHGCALAMCASLKIQASIHVHVHVHELYSAEYPCMVQVCAPCVGQRCVYMYITKMTRTRANLKFHIARLHCIFALHCVLCCPGTSESVSLRLAPECSALPSYANGLFNSLGFLFAILAQYWSSFVRVCAPLLGRLRGRTCLWLWCFTAGCHVKSLPLPSTPSQMEL